MTEPYYRRPAHVAFVELDGGVDGTPLVYLAPLPDGPASVLERTAATIWSEAVADGPDDVADRVARRAGVDPAGIRDTVSAFVAELVERDLLEPVRPAPARPPG
ncbi:MAG TPA: PqqD family protein [Acidimicrobiales bacterium]